MCVYDSVCVYKRERERLTDIQKRREKENVNRKERESERDPFKEE